MPELPPPKRLPPVPSPVACAPGWSYSPLTTHHSPLTTHHSPLTYAELHCRTNFSFLEGASHPDELVARAAELGLAALAVTDRNSLAGVRRAHRAAYARLGRLLTKGPRAAPKGACRLTFDDVAAHAGGLLAGVPLRDAET